MSSIECLSSLPSPVRDTQLLHFAPQRTGVHTEQLGCAAGSVDLPSGSFQHPGDVIGDHPVQIELLIAQCEPGTWMVLDVIESQLVEIELPAFV